jgi:hypothetical protein
MIRVSQSNLQFSAGDDASEAALLLPEIRIKNVYQIVIFPLPPPPIAGFVASKRLTAIQPDGDRTVEALFSHFFGLESPSIFPAVPIAKFTFWLIVKRLLDSSSPTTEFADF